jgi:hypothetical protein
MWLHHDASWWALVLAILALILMYPVSLLANLTTPVLKNWWAERSVASLKKRITNLEKQLVDYEQYPELSEAETYILLATEALSMMLGLCITMLAVVLIVLSQYGMPTVSAHDKMPIVLLALVSGSMAFLLGVIGFGRITKFRTQRSPFDRNNLRKYVGQLKEKLAKRNPSA